MQKCLTTLKVIFVSEKSADKEIKRIRKRPGKYKKPCRAYLCEFCNGYHLTSQDKI